MNFDNFNGFWYSFYFSFRSGKWETFNILNIIVFEYGFSRTYEHLFSDNYQKKNTYFQRNLWNLWTFIYIVILLLLFLKCKIKPLNSFVYKYPWQQFFFGWVWYMKLESPYQQTFFNLNQTTIPWTHAWCFSSLVQISRAYTVASL